MVPVLLNNARVFLNRYPVARGMLTYSLLWPTGCLIQQSLAGTHWRDYDWRKCFRFFIYGGFIVAPSLYCWIRLASLMWPAQNLKSAIAKALTEQVSYTPMAMTFFYFGMSLMESKTVEESLAEVRAKVPPTYKVAICIWPLLQTFNFCVVPEKNRVPFVSLCSLLWTIFLAYMKQLELERLQKGNSVMK
ncbi:mpv17-like protein [Toxorhynchites rutilus septentrionalis]|uniref:mpv17-like protein n=1 Tax=Toxorhynchites rutilus septentrionalis TaxID=329112 RepID=UPI002479692C|nr:mpv17-like protein [Toxorhynchites rutilus septentrionalis]